MKLPRTHCNRILSHKLHWFSSPAKSQAVPWSLFFLEFSLWNDVTPVPCLDALSSIIISSPDFPSVHSLSVSLGLDFIIQDSAALPSSLHWVVLYGSQFSVYFQLHCSEEAWQSFVLDLFCICLKASLSELISVLIS